MSSSGSWPRVNGSPAGILGKHAIKYTTIAAATTPTMVKVMRQPTSRPMARPMGKPKIIAIDVPVATMLTARALWRTSTKREAHTAAMDQKTA